MKTVLRLSGIGAALALLAGIGAPGCTRDDPNKLNGGSLGPPPVCADVTTTTTGSSGSSGSSSSSSGGSTGTGVVEPPPHTILDDRIEDYGEALRTASLKLIGNAPTLAQINELRGAADQAATYAQMVDQMMAQPAFARRMIEF